MTERRTKYIISFILLLCALIGLMFVFGQVMTNKEETETEETPLVIIVPAEYSFTEEVEETPAPEQPSEAEVTPEPAPEETPELSPEEPPEPAPEETSVPEETPVPEETMEPEAEEEPEITPEPLPEQVPEEQAQADEITE